MSLTGEYLTGDRRCWRFDLGWGNHSVVTENTTACIPSLTSMNSSSRVLFSFSLFCAWFIIVLFEATFCGVTGLSLLRVEELLWDTVTLACLLVIGPISAAVTPCARGYTQMINDRNFGWEKAANLWCTLNCWLSQHENKQDGGFVDCCLMGIFYFCLRQSFISIKSWYKFYICIISYFESFYTYTTKLRIVLGHLVVFVYWSKCHYAQSNLIKRKLGRLLKPGRHYKNMDTGSEWPSEQVSC